jgi:hypothetical protein
VALTSSIADAVTGVLRCPPPPPDSPDSSRQGPPTCSQLRGGNRAESHECISAAAARTRQRLTLAGAGWWGGHILGAPPATGARHATWGRPRLQLQAYRLVSIINKMLFLRMSQVPPQKTLATAGPSPSKMRG